jgi:hypothetical protein
MTSRAPSYPASYKYRGFWLILSVLVGLAMGLGGVAALLYTLIIDQSLPLQRRLIFGAFCIGDIALGSYFVAYVMKARLVLYADAIEDRGLFGTRRLPRSEIAGKMVMFSGCQTIFLYPKSRSQRKMMVQVVFPTDQTFDAWMADIPPIDAGYLRARWRR